MSGQYGMTQSGFIPAGDVLTDYFILQTDDTSFILLVDNTSFLLTEAQT